jgi:hypothetical protein
MRDFVVILEVEFGITRTFTIHYAPVTTRPKFIGAFLMIHNQLMSVMIDMDIHHINHNFVIMPKIAASYSKGTPLVSGRTK